MKKFEKSRPSILSCRILDKVYGPFTTPESWVPLPFNKKSRRYLWSDAYGVCNYITMFKETSEQRYLTQARILVEDVHNTLGKYRNNDKRLGKATDLNPLLGGLRIGKENAADDGQYFHYLTKWMFALLQMHLVSAEEKYLLNGIDLAKVAYKAFVFIDKSIGARSNDLIMAWKLDVNLQTPIGSGNLDPYDGYVTYKLLQKGSTKDRLGSEIETFSKIIHQKFGSFHTTDELDAGEALWLCHFYPSEDWSKRLTNVCMQVVDGMFILGHFNRPKEDGRLMFREMGMTIGIQSVDGVKDTAVWRERVNWVHGFWEKNLYDRDTDISPLMFVSSLNPGVLL